MSAEDRPWTIPDDLWEEITASSRSSWSPVDFTSVLDGTWEPPQATVGRRADGVGLFYPGRMHAVAAESEGGKTWLALCACLDEVNAGRDVVYVDFEDDMGGIVGRLLTMGARSSVLQAHFTYLRPEEPVQAGVGALEAVLDIKPSLAILDGVTEAMVLHGLNPIDNVDVAKFSALVVRKFTAGGAAAVALDHVTKNSEGRGRYAIGAVHKLNGLNGAQYLLENRRPFGVGLKGVSTLRIAKDRPGQLRKLALAGRDGLSWFGDLLVDSRHDITEVSIETPHESDKPFRPTTKMHQISEALALHGDLSQKKIRAAVQGNTDAIIDALNLLILDGYVTDKTPHHLIKPYVPETSE